MGQTLFKLALTGILLVLLFGIGVGFCTNRVVDPVITSLQADFDAADKREQERERRDSIKENSPKNTERILFSVYSNKQRNKNLNIETLSKVQIIVYVDRKSKKGLLSTSDTKSWAGKLTEIDKESWIFQSGHTRFHFYNNMVTMTIDSEVIEEFEINKSHNFLNY